MNDMEHVLGYILIATRITNRRPTDRGNRRRETVVSEELRFIGIDYNSVECEAV